MSFTDHCWHFVSLTIFHFLFSLLQLLVKATRSAVSQQTVTCTVDITVSRNENGPVFQFPIGLNSYVVTIPDTTPPGEIIQTISATDADGVGTRAGCSYP